jgi:hypothetical protein
MAAKQHSILTSLRDNATSDHPAHQDASIARYQSQEFISAAINLLDRWIEVCETCRMQHLL